MFNNITRAFIVAVFVLSMAYAGTAAAETAKASSGLDLASYKGKALYVDFWASWCGPCRASFPAMNEWREQYDGESLAIVAVNVDSKHAAAQRFLAKYPANFDIVYDPEGKLATEYDVKGMPSSYLFNAQGELVYKHVGFRKKDKQEIRLQIDKLLREDQNAEQRKAGLSAAEEKEEEI